MAWKLDPHNNLATLQNLVTRMPSAAFLHPQNAPKSLVAGAYSAPPNPLAGLRRPISKGGKEWRDFGPSQCWRQIDAYVLG